jgi:hypothetical protein
LSRFVQRHGNFLAALIRMRAWDSILKRSRNLLALLEAADFGAGLNFAFANAGNANWLRIFWRLQSQ